MNRINPLYIWMLLFIITLFLAFKLTKKQDELSKVKEAYSETFKLSSQLSELKKSYADDKKIKSSLEKILKTAVLKDAKLNQKIKNSSVVISSQNIDINTLNYLMSKLLNSSYNITELKIKHLNNTKASLYVEVSW